MYEEILYDVDERIATLTLNRPEKLNAFTDRTLQEIRHALATAEQDENVVAIILTGAGRGFCAGADMGMLGDIENAGDISVMNQDTGLEPLQAGDPEMGSDFERGTFAYFLTVRKPIIAAVNGPCAGVGLAMALFCDLDLRPRTPRLWQRSRNGDSRLRLGRAGCSPNSWGSPRELAHVRTLTA